MNILLRMYPGDYYIVLIANALIQVTLILFAALILIRIVGWSNAAWRYHVCLVAIISMLIGPALSCVVPARGIGLLTVQPQRTPRPQAKVDRAMTTALRQVDEIPTGPRSGGADEYRQGALQHFVPQDGGIPLSGSDALRSAAVLALAVWLSGGVLLFARWCHGLHHIATLRKRVQLLDNGEVSDVLLEVRKTLGVEQLPVVATLPDLDRPVMIGLIRPLVILPENLIRILSRPKLAEVLVHECAHFVCRHHLVGILQRLSAVCFWPHPLVHLLNRELARAREEVCDNYVLRLGDAPRYARTLLELSDLLLNTPSESCALGLFHFRWRLEDRIAGLLDKRRKTMICVNRWVIATLAIPFLLAGATHFLQAEPAEGGNTELAVASPDALAKSSPAATDSTAQDSELSQSAANLRAIMTAIHTFHGIAGHYPPAASGWGYDRKANEWFRERRNVSWRVILLPLLGERELFEKFRLNEPWDSEHNRPLVAQMPAVYRAAGSKAEAGKTNYLGAFGPNAAFPDKGTITVPDIPDGTSMTIMVVEVPDQSAVEWTRPEDFPIDTKEPAKRLLGFRKGGFLTAFADGAPQFISSDIPPETLMLLFVRNDRRPVFAAGEQERWTRFVRPAAKPAEHPAKKDQGRGS